MQYKKSCSRPSQFKFNSYSPTFKRYFLCKIRHFWSQKRCFSTFKKQDSILDGAPFCPNAQWSKGVTKPFNTNSCFKLMPLGIFWELFSDVVKSWKLLDFAFDKFAEKRAILTKLGRALVQLIVSLIQHVFKKMSRFY